MLPYFPIPYPDETIYSLFARYSVYTGISFASTIEELTGGRKYIGNAKFPRYLGVLHNKIKDMGLTIDNIIMNHTAYPYVALLQSPTKRKELRELMINSNGSSRGIGSLKSLNGSLQHCAKCILEDYDKYGESYWHRIHQMPGVFVCPFHKELLLEIEFNKFKFIYPDVSLMSKTICDENVSVHTFNLLNKYAYEVNWLLNNECLAEFNSFEGKIKNKLKSKEYYRSINAIDRVKLSDDLLNYYKNETLKYFNSTINDYGDWPHEILNKNKHHSSIKYILLIIFLWGSLKSFVEDKKNLNKSIEYTSFGSGPWPCLNPACHSYRQDVINKVRIIKYKKPIRIVGVFECTCEFKYSRKTSTNKYEVFKKISLGPVFKKRLYELLKENNSVDDIMIELDVSGYTVRKYRNKMNDDTFFQKQRNHNSRKVKVDDTQKLVTRNSWLKLRKYTPILDTKEYYRLYAWLYRNDKEWLDRNVRRNQNRIDWKKRDEDALRLLKKTMANWHCYENIKPRKRNKTFFLTLLQKKLSFCNLAKLPKTKDYIDNIIETNKQFKVRIIRWAIDQLVKQGKNINKSNILKLIGVSEKNSVYVTEYLNSDYYFKH